MEKVAALVNANKKMAEKPAPAATATPEVTAAYTLLGVAAPATATAKSIRAAWRIKMMAVYEQPEELAKVNAALKTLEQLQTEDGVKGHDDDNGKSQKEDIANYFDVEEAPAPSTTDDPVM